MVVAEILSNGRVQLLRIVLLFPPKILVTIYYLDLINVSGEKRRFFWVRAEMLLFFWFVQKYRVFFLTGSAQKVLSMELVPPNSKKTTKYTGSAQYTKNG